MNASPRIRVTGLLVLLSVTAIVFRDVLFTDSAFSFRDTAHFYAPLWRYIQSQWESGIIPLWNPLENAGVPLAGTPTSAVFYPGKLIFFLPLEFDTALELFVITHVVFAGLAMYFLARHWDYSPAAAILAGLSYAFCGNVLFQHCNVVFLCGAAWLPLALLTGERAIATCRMRDALLHGLVIAMIVLCGDAQLAYLSGACTALYGLVRWFCEERSESERQSWRHRLRNGRLAVLGLAALVAGAASAVQVLPTLEYSRQSVRAQSEVPRNIFGLPQHLMSDHEPMPRPDTGQPPKWYDTMVGNPPPPAKHELAVFAFQAEPWRLPELLYPGLSGPTYRRWGVVLGIEGNSWTPTFYMGAIASVLSLLSLRWRRSDARTCWVTWIATLATLAACGNWTPWKLIRWLCDIQSGGPTADSVGGVYWLMQVLLPGFADFRYPAKLLVLTAAALSLLAARGWDHVMITNPRRITRAATFVAVVSLFLTLATIVCWGAVDSLIDPLDRELFDSMAARGDVEYALLHTTVVLATFAAVIHWRDRLKSVICPATLVVLLCGIDLAAAHFSLVETVPDALAERPSQAIEHLRSRLDAAEPDVPLRAYSLLDRSLGGLDPNQRYSVEREYLDGQFHLDEGVCSIPELGTMQLNELQAWFDSLPYPAGDSVAYVRARRAMDAWGVSAFLLPPGGHRESNPNLTSLGLRTRWEEPRWSTAEPQVAPFGGPLQQVVVEAPMDVLINDSAFPRVWIVHEVLAVPPIDAGRRDAWLPLLRAMVFPDRQWIDLRTTAVVEDAALSRDSRSNVIATPPDESSVESASITAYAPSQVEIQCSLESPGLVVLSDVYFSGWNVEVSSDGSEWEEHSILRTNRMMRGVYLPAGEHQLRFRYEPVSFRIGAAVSLTTWLLCPLTVVAVWFRKRRLRDTPAA